MYLILSKTYLSLPFNFSWFKCILVSSFILRYLFLLLIGSSYEPTLASCLFSFYEVPAFLLSIILENRFSSSKSLLKVFLLWCLNKSWTRLISWCAKNSACQAGQYQMFKKKKKKRDWRVSIHCILADLQ